MIGRKRYKADDVPRHDGKQEDFERRYRSGCKWPTIVRVFQVGADRVHGKYQIYIAEISIEPKLGAGRETRVILDNNARLTERLTR